ncbi:hypothetical protein E1B28_003561 [Marasmius oreades]|uniref:Uncharacterized protein n=1 Tax=Marasmius oreades TaxID=181124 RepID=A0A9P7RM73_9AGAR|nr:uncharacterized protein E1B28_003561 [Marasmius oreades]KAG7086040.1 hypothetical protein E1B28_003561 [Marasmius oreades]
MADEESYLLIAQLHLQDLQEIAERRHRKGKSREGAPPTDEEYAFQLQAELMSNFVTDVIDEKGPGAGRIVDEVDTEEAASGWVPEVKRNSTSTVSPSSNGSKYVMWRPPMLDHDGWRQTSKGESRRNRSVVQARSASTISPGTLSSKRESGVKDSTSVQNNHRHSSSQREVKRPYN